MKRWWGLVLVAMITSGCAGTAPATSGPARATTAFDVQMRVDRTSGVVAHNPFARPPVSPYAELLVSAFTELPASPYVDLPPSPYELPSSPY